MKPEPIQDPRKRPISWGHLGLVAIISGVLGGAVALAMVALMVWLSQRTWVVDDAASHGISEAQSSRLGGVAVFLGAIAFFVVTDLASGSGKMALSNVISSVDKLPGYITYVFLPQCFRRFYIKT